MKLSRTQLAEFLIQNSDSKSVSMVAGYLVSNGRSKELPMIIRQAEALLSTQGRTVARVSSARKLSADQQRAVVKLIKEKSTETKSVEIINDVDPSLLGGVVVRTPEMEVDLSIRNRLNRLKKA